MCPRNDAHNSYNTISVLALFLNFPLFFAVIMKLYPGWLSSSYLIRVWTPLRPSCYYGSSRRRPRNQRRGRLRSVYVPYKRPCGD
jgi:hypothetical protein